MSFNTGPALMAYTQQVAMCLSDKVTLCTSFNTGPALTAYTQQVAMCLK